jgi:hypothetical protein
MENADYAGFFDANFRAPVSKALLYKKNKKNVSHQRKRARKEGERDVNISAVLFLRSQNKKQTRAVFTHIVKCLPKSFFLNNTPSLFVGQIFICGDR